MAIKQQKPEGKIKLFLEGLFAVINIFGLLFIIDSLSSGQWSSAVAAALLLVVVLLISYKLGLLYDRSKKPF